MTTALVVTADWRFPHIQTWLKDTTLTIEYAHHPSTVRRKLEQQEIDVVMIDTMSPTIDGWLLLRGLRETSHIPIMLIVEDSMNDILLGLSLGADDCVSYNMHSGVLKARIHALVRRTQQVYSSL